MSKKKSKITPVDSLDDKLLDLADDNMAQISSIPIDRRVGKVVKKKRQALGLTLSELSIGASLSPGMISRIENGQSSASLDVLERICASLGVSMASFMNEIDKPQGSAQLIKRKEQPEVIRTGTRYGHNYKLLSYQRGPQQPFEPFLIEMDRDSEEYPSFQHPGIEFIYMLEGKMKYKFGSELYLLEPGDAFTFSGEVEHGPGEISSDKVVFISIIYHDL